MMTWHCSPRAPCHSGRDRSVHRKDRVFEALRSLCTQRPTQSSVLRRHTGFSAEEVAELAEVDRTNASRDLNLLAQEGMIERIPGRPVLFRLKTPAGQVETARSDDTSKKNGNTHIRAPHATFPTSTKIVPQAGSSTISATIHIGAVVTSFETLIGSSDGLKVAIQQAKAAILYPPRGLHTLLHGPSGVGKTTLARLMHAFALEQQSLSPDAPFVSFNCADYAGNPQLLMAHLFGVVRGAYTGADHDRIGLVEQAHRGILFLDEVHRLPPEGQEMLFYLMDRERFRRMGDAKERQASLLLLAATTEDPNTALLPTFRRRIPMVITLPGLQERTVTERYELLRAFFTTECSSIGTNIHVAPQILHALLLYDCPGNIGQLRTDVQLTCARAYLEYRTNNLSEMNVHTGVLPEHIRRGLLRTIELHRTLEPLLHQLEATHIFTPTGLSLNANIDSAQNLYEIISSELHTLRSNGMSEQEISKLLNLDIQHYFQHFADTVSQERSEISNHLVDEHILTVSHSIVLFAEKQLERSFPEKLSLVLAMHLASALEHIAQGRTLVALQSTRQTYPIEYAVAQRALQHASSALNTVLPDSETDVLTILLANADTLLSNEQAAVGIVVAAHGRGIATGITELASTLVGFQSSVALELSLEQSPEELLVQVERCVYDANQGSGVLLLVDFTSLLPLGDLITQRTGIQTRTVAGVSAPLAVEATRKAQRASHITLDQLANSLAQMNLFGDIDKTALERVPQLSIHHKTLQPLVISDPQTERVILSVCLTGSGSAIKLAELIEEHLPELRGQNIEIICMDINLSSLAEADVQRQIGNRPIVAVVGTINPRLKSYPFISLTELLFGDGIARLRTLLGETLIDPALLQPKSSITSPLSAPTFTRRAELMREISYTLSQRLFFLNPVRALPLIEHMIDLIEVEVGENFELEVLAGLILHLACVLERGSEQENQFVSEAVRQRVGRQYRRELSICHSALQVLGAQIARPLPDEEAYNIVGILRQVDIFAVNA